MGIRKVTSGERIHRVPVFHRIACVRFLVMVVGGNRLLGMVTGASPTTWQQKAVDVDTARGTSRVSVSVEYFLLQFGHNMSLFAN